MTLPVNIDTTYADDAGDASVKLHQQHHDTIHTAVNGLSTTYAQIDANGRLLPTQFLTPTAKTANYTAKHFDWVLVDASAGAVTITLPAVANGVVVRVKKTDNTANVVTVSPASGTIDGATSVTIGTLNQSLDLGSDGTNWFVG